MSGVDDFKKGRSGSGVLVWMLCGALESCDVVVGRGSRRSCDVIEGEVRRGVVWCVRGEGGQEESKSGAAEGGGGRVEHRGLSWEARDVFVARRGEGGGEARGAVPVDVLVGVDSQRGSWWGGEYDFKATEVCVHGDERVVFVEEDEGA